MHSTDTFRLPHDVPARAAARAVNLDDDLDATFEGADGGQKRWLGTVLFWAGVAVLITARVVLFDPAASRPIGGFPDLISTATAHH
jgi:hypothetical protein